MLADAPNIQSLWGDLIVEELVRNGVEHFVVCPGSRSTPLVQAIARNPEAKATVWNDERGGAFHALGIGRVNVAAIITTSGTAVANLLPAVVEASLDGASLIVITADRPPELHEVGANQSIRQVGIFADHVRWSIDLPAPTTDFPAAALLSTIDEAVAKALDGHAGPVHVNCAFREPLAPTDEPWDPAWLDPLRGRWFEHDYAREPWLTIHPGVQAEATPDDSYLPLLFKEAERGMIVCGSMATGIDQARVVRLAEVTGWPIWADIRSGLRHNPNPTLQCIHFDRIATAEPDLKFDTILQFGGRITSKRMQAWLDRQVGSFYVLVDPEPSRLDPSHVVRHRYRLDIAHTCEWLLAAIEGHAPRQDLESLGAASARIEQAIDAAVEAGEGATEPWIARWLSRHVATDHALFLSNSMPIRDMQAYAAIDGGSPLVFSNRGASGIDGIVSTAAGVARGIRPARPVTLFIGDLALLHDVNALMHVRTLEQPLTIVVVNNGGGGIFSFLPIAEHEDVLRPYVETPHDIRFEGICASFGLPYTHVDSREDFEAAYRAAIESGVSSVIEVRSDIAANKAHHDRIEAAIADALKDA